MQTNRFWKALSATLWGCSLCCLCTFTVAGYEYWQRHMLQKQIQQAEQRRQAVQQRSRFLLTNQATVQWYRSHQAAWHKSGLMQAAQPAQWVATWAAMQQQYQLPHMQYTIRNTIHCHPARCPLTGLPEDIEEVLTVTPVELRWQLQHEADSLQWLQRLQQYYGPMLQLQSCRWSRLHDALLIESQCQLVMVNLSTLFVSPLAK